MCKKKISEIAKQRIGEKNPFFGKHHTEETKEKLREKNKGTLSPSRICISIDNINYVSMTDASKKLSIPLPTIL